MGMMKDQTDDSLKLISIKALRDSLSFYKQKLQEVDVRNFLLDNLFIACMHTNIQLKELSLQCLIDFCVMQYPNLSEKLNQIV